MRKTVKVPVIIEAKRGYFGAYDVEDGKIVNEWTEIRYTAAWRFPWDHKRNRYESRPGEFKTKRAAEIAAEREFRQFLKFYQEGS